MCQNPRPLGGVGWALGWAGLEGPVNLRSRGLNASFPNFRNARKEAGKTKQKGGNVVEWIGRASRGRTPKPGMEPASFPNFRKATTEEQGKREKNSAARHLPAEIHHFILMASEARSNCMNSHMRMPGVEPGSQAWEACIIPPHYML